MGNARLEKQKENLVKAGLMAPEDNLIDFLQASCMERLVGKLGQWKQGWAYFTEEKLIVTVGLAGGVITIPYKSIRGLEKCSQGLFPMGIAITHEDAESSQTVTDKISVTKRNKWLELLADKSGVSVS